MTFSKELDRFSLHFFKISLQIRNCREGDRSDPDCLLNARSPSARSVQAPEATSAATAVTPSSASPRPGKARHHLLGLSRRKTGHPGPNRNPLPPQHHPPPVELRHDVLTIPSARHATRAGRDLRLGAHAGRRCSGPHDRVGADDRRPDDHHIGPQPRDRLVFDRKGLADSVAGPLRQSGYLGEAIHVVIPRPGQTVHDIILRRRMVQKIGPRSNSLLAVDNSLLPQKNSLLGIQKFPAPLRREFGCKPMDSLAEWRRKLANEPQIFKNSLQIPCYTATQ